MSYNGYLKPYVERIKQLADKGLSNKEIARAIHKEGARSSQSRYYTDPEGEITSMSGLIRIILLGSDPVVAKYRLEYKIPELEKTIKNYEDKLITARIALAEARKELSDVETRIGRPRPPVVRRVSQAELDAKARRRKAAELRRSGKYFHEVGEVMGISPNHARNLVWRAAYDEVGRYQTEAEALFQAWSKECRAKQRAAP